MSVRSTALGTLRRPSKSIRFHLLVLVLLVSLPLLGLFAWQAIGSAEVHRGAIEQKRAQVATLVSARVDQEVSLYIGALRALAASPELANGEFGRFDLLASGLLRDPNIVRVWATSPDGDLASAPTASQRADIDAKFISTVLDGGPTVSGVRGAGIENVSFLIGVPIIGATPRRIGVALELRAGFLSRLAFRKTGMQPDWVVGIVDGANHFVARSLQPELRVGRPARLELGVAANGADDDGSFSNVSLEGVEMLNSFHRSSLTHWTTVVAVPSAALMSPLWQNLALVTIGGGIVLMMTIWLATVQARRISQPLQTLGDFAIALNSGRPFREAASGISELEAVRTVLEGTMRSSAHLAAVVATSADAIITVAVDGKIQSWNAAAERLFGYPPEEIIGRPKSIIVPSGLAQEFEHEKARANAGESVRFETRRRRRDGSLIDVSITSAPIQGPDGKVIAISSIIHDISQRKSDEAHILDLMRELSHRSKNQIAVIQSIARRTAKSADSLEQFSEEFSSRMQGLSITFDLLTKRDWKDAGVEELVLGQLGVFVDVHGSQLSVCGPDVELGATYIEAIGLALHELATNAVKYGAWSSPAGSVNVDWRLHPTETEGLELEFDWREAGGPIVKTPMKKGFGSVIFESVVPRSVNGSSRVEYNPDGVHWRLQFALPAA